MLGLGFTVTVKFKLLPTHPLFVGVMVIVPEIFTSPGLAAPKAVVFPVLPAPSPILMFVLDQV